LEIGDGRSGEPAFGLGVLQIEAGDEFDGRVVGDDDDLVGAEFIGQAGAVVEEAVAFGGEAGADVLEEVGENGVLGGVEGFEAEAGFEIWEGGEHKVLGKQKLEI
jgi:hypothetical protein